MANVIYNATLGHVGLVNKTFELIDRHFYQNNSDIASDTDVIEYLLSRTYYDNICRTLDIPHYEFNEDEKRIIREIILEGYSQPRDKKIASELLKAGTYLSISVFKLRVCGRYWKPLRIYCSYSQSYL